MLDDGASGSIETTRVDANTGFLQATGTSYELVEHARTMSAAAEARAAHFPPDRVAKTIVLHDGDVYVIAAIPAYYRHSVLLDPREIVRITAAQTADICEG